MPVELSTTVHHGAPIKFTFFSPVHYCLSFPFLPNKNVPAQAAVTLEVLLQGQLDDLIRAGMMPEHTACSVFPLPHQRVAF